VTHEEEEEEEEEEEGRGDRTTVRVCHLFAAPRTGTAVCCIS